MRSWLRPSPAKKAQLDSIESIEWPPGLIERVREAAPLELSDPAIALMLDGFKSYLFALRLWGPRSSVAMPSRAVDAIWHEAILHTRFYQSLCESRLGWFAHHDPGPASGAKLSEAERQIELEGLARAWAGASRWEAIGSSSSADWRPALFAADELIGWPRGFHHSPEMLESVKTRARELSASQTWASKRPAP